MGAAPGSLAPSPSCGHGQIELGVSGHRIRGDRAGRLERRSRPDRALRGDSDQRGRVLGYFITRPYAVVGARQAGISVFAPVGAPRSSGRRLRRRAGALDRARPAWARHAAPDGRSGDRRGAGRAAWLAARALCRLRRRLHDGGRGDRSPLPALRLDKSGALGRGCRALGGLVSGEPFHDLGADTDSPCGDARVHGCCPCPLQADERIATRCQPTSEDPPARGQAAITLALVIGIAALLGPTWPTRPLRPRPRRGPVRLFAVSAGAPALALAPSWPRASRRGRGMVARTYLQGVSQILMVGTEV